jgi:streptogramin lyase
VAADSTIAPGTTIAGYELHELAGRGGMGDVYRAYDHRLERTVALKLLTPRLSDDETFRERMLRESRLAAGLDHPNVVPIYEAGEAESRLFLAMRYVDGDLRDLLRSEHALEPERAVAIAAQVASALDAAHARGLVHRDVKPSNVLLDHGDGREHVYLADFGLVQSASDTGPTDGHLLGTVDYAAPEQIRGDPVDARADVYGLGCLLYECLTGVVPFVRPSEVATIFAHLHEEPPLVTERRPTLPAAVGPVLARALAKEPGERQASCEELVREVRDAFGLFRPPPRRRLLVPAILAAAAVACATAVGVAVLVRGGSSPPPTGHVVGIDPATGAVTATFGVSQYPGVVAISAGRVWVADFRDGWLWRIDPGTGDVTRLTSTGEPRDLTAIGRKIYVAADGETAFDGIVARYESATGNRETGVRVLACSIAAGEGVVWAAGCPYVDRLSTDDGKLRILRAAPVPYQQPRNAENYRYSMRDMAIGLGAIWVLGDPVDRRVYRLDLHTGRVLGITRLSFAPRSIAAGEGGVWVTGPIDDVVARLDQTTGRVTGIVHVPAGASGIAAGAGGVWVASALVGSVSRIDPRTLRVAHTTDVPGLPREVAVGAGKVWVTTDVE